MIILAIVGSVLLEGNEEAERLIQEALDKYKPDKVVSGGAKGIDSMAARAARARGIEVEEFKPTVRKWDAPGGFKERNLQIALACTHLVRIVSSQTKTFGSGYTMVQAQKEGKPTENFVVQQ